MELLEKIGTPGFDIYINEKFLHNVSEGKTYEMDWLSFRSSGKIPYLRSFTPFSEHFLKIYGGRVDCDFFTFKEYGKFYKSLKNNNFNDKLHFEVYPYLNYLKTTNGKTVVVRECKSRELAYKKGIFLDLFLDSNSALDGLIFTKDDSFPEYMENSKKFFIKFKNFKYSEFDFLLLNKISQIKSDFIFIFEGLNFLFSYFVLNRKLFSFFIHDILYLNEFKLNHYISDMVSGRDFSHELILDNGVYANVKYKGGDFFKFFPVYRFNEKEFLRRLFNGS